MLYQHHYPFSRIYKVMISFATKLFLKHPDLLVVKGLHHQCMNTNYCWLSSHPIQFNSIQLKPTFISILHETSQRLLLRSDHSTMLFITIVLFYFILLYFISKHLTPTTYSSHQMSTQQTFDTNTSEFLEKKVPHRPRNNLFTELFQTKCRWRNQNLREQNSNFNLECWLTQINTN